MTRSPKTTCSTCASVATETRSSSRPGRELDHKYTLMTEHVCPVGALTSRDFRFKARVWFLKSGEGVCTGCATGCNTHVDYDPRYGKVYRLRPRDNEDVNKFWMCDDGMMTYTAVTPKTASWRQRPDAGRHAPPSARTRRSSLAAEGAWWRRGRQARLRAQRAEHD